MKYELGDHSVVRCPENHLAADIEFKTKGWVGGTYNAIGGTIKNDSTGEVLYELSGLWSGEMFIRDTKTGQKRLLFDATRAKHAPPLARPIEEQGDRESQKLWLSTVRAVHIVDHENATIEKAKIEDRQREEAKKREEAGEEWIPKLFRHVEAGPGGSEEGEEDLEWIIDAQLYVSSSMSSLSSTDQTRDGSDPNALTEQILSIAPILPGQGPPGERKANPQPVTSSQEAQQVSSDQVAAPPNASAAPVANLIDFDSRPPSTAPPEANVKTDSIAGNPIHPTSNPQPTPIDQAVTQNIAPAGVPPPRNIGSSQNLMDDHDDNMSLINHQTSNLDLHKPLVPSGKSALKRSDTETSEVDVFVDAEG